MALSGQIVDLVGLNLLDDANEIGGIREVAVMQPQVQVLFMRILIKMVDAIRVERGGTAFDAMDLVPFGDAGIPPDMPRLGR